MDNIYTSIFDQECYDEWFYEMVKKKRSRLMFQISNERLDLENGFINIEHEDFYDNNKNEVNRLCVKSDFLSVKNYVKC